jgi:hypothetical protein
LLNALSKKADSLTARLLCSEKRLMLSSWPTSTVNDDSPKLEAGCQTVLRNIKGTKNLTLVQNSSSCAVSLMRDQILLAVRLESDLCDEIGIPELPLLLRVLQLGGQHSDYSSHQKHQKLDWQHLRRKGWRTNLD